MTLKQDIAKNCVDKDNGCGCCSENYIAQWRLLTILKEYKIDINMSDDQRQTTENFLSFASDDELFCVVGEFLSRAREKGLLKMPQVIDEELYLTDKQIFSVVKEMKREIKKKRWL